MQIVQRWLRYNHAQLTAYFIQIASNLSSPTDFPDYRYKENWLSHLFARMVHAVESLRACRGPSFKSHHNY
jgi:hypothetical protein